MLKKILFTSILILVTSGSYAQPPFYLSYENLSQDDRKIVDKVLESFLMNHIIFLEELSQVNKLVGAAGISDIETVTDEKLDDSHFELGIDTHKKEHLAARVSPAEKGPDGKYHTPLQILGEKAYSYKILHTVEIQGKNIKISSSRLSEKNDSRIETAPNQRLIRNIADTLQGTVSNNSIKLP